MNQSRWQNFLNSLSTRGGAIFLLFVLSLIGFFITLHIVHHNEDQSMFAAGLIATVSNFTGALLLALKGSSESVSSASISPNGATQVTVSDSTASTSAGDQPNGDKPVKP